MYLNLAKFLIEITSKTLDTDIKSIRKAARKGVEKELVKRVDEILSKSEIDNASQKYPEQIKTIKSLLNSPKKLLATILITNNFINVAIVILFAFLGEVLFESITTTWVKFLLEVVLVTFFILLFGEIIPKIYARRNALQFSRFISKPLNILKGILAASEEEVTVEYNNSNAKFSFENTQLICRLIDGKYPNYEAVIPKENPNLLIIDRSLFLNSTNHRYKLRNSS